MQGRRACAGLLKSSKIVNRSALCVPTEAAMKAKNGTQFNREQGQGLVEYALIVLFLAIVMIAGLNVLGKGILSSMYNVVLAGIP